MKIAHIKISDNGWLTVEIADSWIHCISSELHITSPSWQKLCGVTDFSRNITIHNTLFNRNSNPLMLLAMLKWLAIAAITGQRVKSNGAETKMINKKFVCCRVSPIVWIEMPLTQWKLFDWRVEYNVRNENNMTFRLAVIHSVGLRISIVVNIATVVKRALLEATNKLTKHSICAWILI